MAIQVPALWRLGMLPRIAGLALWSGTQLAAPGVGLTPVPRAVRRWAGLDRRFLGVAAVAAHHQSRGSPHTRAKRAASGPDLRRTA